MRNNKKNVKKRFIVVIIILVLILFVPVPGDVYKDGGTREYSAFMYKIVKWKRLSKNGIYENTCVYFFPDNLKYIDELWEIKH